MLSSTRSTMLSSTRPHPSYKCGACGMRTTQTDGWRDGICASCCHERDSAPARPGEDASSPGRITYRLEYTHCSKTRCGCTRGQGQSHGPFWYAYWVEGGRSHSRYIGKDLPSPRPTEIRPSAEAAQLA